MIFIFTVLLGVYSQPLMFVAITRHGSRSPMKFMHWDNEQKWPHGPQQLTQVGMHQEYLLGEYLKEKYIKNSALLSEEYIPGEFEIFSTKLNRTMQSAQALVHGLYPKDSSFRISHIELPQSNIDTGKYNNTEVPTISKLIPVQVSTQLIEPLMRPLSGCQEYVDHAKRRKNSAAIREIYKKYRDVIKVVEERLQILPKEAEALALDVLDSVLCNKLEGFEYPKEFTDEWIERAKLMYMEVNRFVLYQPEFVARYAGSRLFEQIRLYFDFKEMRQNVPKGVVYSADDSTIMDLFVALDLPITEQPLPASVLIFELYRENEINKVKVLYNNVPIYLPGKAEDAEWNEFRNAVLMRIFVDNRSACSDIQRVVETKNITEQSNSDLIKLLAFDLALMIVAVLGIRYFIKNLHN